jgi:hypothetical protein
MSKPTIATVKAFMRKNLDNLHIKRRSEFDPQIDGHAWNDNAQFVPVKQTDSMPDYKHGIEGVWIVRYGSKNCIAPYSDENWEGFEVSNCCARFTIVIRKGGAA